MDVHVQLSIQMSSLDSLFKKGEWVIDLKAPHYDCTVSKNIPFGRILTPNLSNF